MSDITPEMITAAVKGGVQIIGGIIQLISRALAGDGAAVRELRRVDDVLTAASPTLKQFDRAEDIAAGKPPGGEA